MDDSNLTGSTDVINTDSGGRVGGHPAAAEQRAKAAAFHERMRSGEFGAPAAAVAADLPKPAAAEPGKPAAPAATGTPSYALPAAVAALVPADDPVLAEYRSQARELGLSEAQWESLAAKFASDTAAGQRIAKLRGGEAAPSKADREAADAAYIAGEIKALGAEGAPALRALGAWRAELRASGVIANDAELREFNWFSGSAAGVRLLAKIMGIAKGARR